jgi:tyrosyl-tRNA synthetase
MTLQALDFATLYRERGVELQMGGADQWGNITAGLELIRRTAGGDADESPAHGIAYKLLLSPSGAKFGKSEGGESVWLDPARTTPYAFYQYWLNTDDRDVGTYLRWFTLFDREAVEALDAAVAARPEAREAQRRLAFDVTARVHGPDAAREAERQGRAAFTPDLASLSAEDLAAMREQVPSFVLGRDALASALDTAIGSSAYPSKGEARRQMANGGFYVNNVRITDPAAPLPAPLHGRFWIVRTGKRNVRLVEPVE